LIPFPHGEPEAALDKLSVSPLAREFAWLPDSRGIVFSDRSAISMHAHLYQAEVSGGRMEQITNGTGSESSPTVSPQGKTVAFGSTTIDYDVIEVRLDGTILQTLKSPVSDVSPSVSGDQLAYVTNRTGEPEIWLKTSNQAWDRPIVTANSFGEDQTLFLFDTTFAPDARRIAYRRADSHGEAIWISTIAADPPIRLGKEPGNAFQRGPAWSPDGNEIVYTSMRNGRYALIRARVGGLEPPVVLAENAGTCPRWSPAGDWIATARPGEGVTLFSADGKTRKDFGTGEWLLHGWTGDSKSVIGIRVSRNRKLDIVSIDISTGVEVAIGDLGPYPAAFAFSNALGASPFRGFTFAADGRSFVTSILRATGDIWLMKRER
jgi:Tol biopolymer transport system component